MSDYFQSLIDSLKSTDFEEIPVLPEEFVYGHEYLDFTSGGTRDIKLSDYQMTTVNAATQILKKETVFDIYGEEQGAIRWDQTKSEITMVFGKGCHAPYTPVFNAKTGKWERLDSFTSPNNTVAGYSNKSIKQEYATESFQEGYGQMVRVTTGLGLVEDVYIGHKYLSYNDKGPVMKEVGNMLIGDKVAVALNFEPVEIKPVRAITILGNEDIPEEIYSAPNEGVRGYLLSKFNDGVWFSANEESARTLQLLLLRAGIVSVLTKEKGYTLTIKEETNESVYWDEIVSIEDIGEGEYWTITVPNSGNYVGAGIVSANSGKDLLATIICAYIVYVLLCLKDPSKYYGKPADNSIDIINVATNAQQANNVFFKNFVSLIKNAPWFKGKYDAKVAAVDFDKNVHVYSGHSERESYEGYNCILVILDEIDGFREPGPNAPESATSAPAIYETYRHSVTSRFAGHGKLLLLSFPRRKDGFILKHYEGSIASKEVVLRKEVVKIDESRPDGIPENEISIEWEEDHIGMYTQPGLFCLKRPSWEVNPTKKIQDYTPDFIANYPAALGKYACMPPEQVEGLFRDREKVENAFNVANGLDNDTGVFYDWFKPEEGKKYFIHVDLAKKHDRCAVAMAHVSGWEQRQINQVVSSPVPKIVVDCVKYWTPTRDKSVDFVEVRNFIVALRQRGFNVRLVTFDRWAVATDMMEYLDSMSMKTGSLSVGIGEYTSLVMVVQEDRLAGPNIPLLHKELMELRLLNSGRVEGPRSGSDDLADAVAGAVHNAIAHTPRGMDQEIEIITGSDMLQGREEAAREEHQGLIRPPGVTMPRELSDWIGGMRVL